MRLCFIFFLHFLWLCCYALFNLCRQVLWLFDGTLFKIHQNCNINSYKGSVQALDILWRHKVDHMVQSSASNNFITWHRCFVDPEYVLEDQVSLYTISPKEALFIEVRKGDDPTNSDAGAFFRVAQFTLAQRLIIMPIHVFHALGQKIGLPNQKVIFVGNTVRCGSTLLTQVFEETGYCMAYSEPDAVNALTQLKKSLSEEEMQQCIHDCFAFLCKPVTGKSIKAYIIKIQGITMLGLPNFVKIIPESYKMFMYRNGLAVCKSMAKASHEMPLVSLAVTIGHFSPQVMKYFAIQFGMPQEKIDFRVLSRAQFFSILWASLMKCYIDFRASGMDIVGIRYEDLVDDPTHFFKAVFSHCDLPYDAGAVERAMSRDSQRASKLSMDTLKKYNDEEFTREVKEQTDKICGIFNVPQLAESFIPSGTIGHQGSSVSTTPGN